LAWGTYWALYWVIATCTAWSLTAMGCTLLGSWWDCTSLYLAAAGFLYFGVRVAVVCYVGEIHDLSRHSVEVYVAA
jgi:hypothetical protein